MFAGRVVLLQIETETYFVVLSLNVLEMGKLSKNSSAKIHHQQSRKWARLQLPTPSAALVQR